MTQSLYRSFLQDDDRLPLPADVTNADDPAPERGPGSQQQVVVAHPVSLSPQEGDRAGAAYNHCEAGPGASARRELEVPRSAGGRGRGGRGRRPRALGDGLGSRSEVGPPWPSPGRVGPGAASPRPGPGTAAIGSRENGRPTASVDVPCDETASSASAEVGDHDAGSGGEDPADLRVDPEPEGERQKSELASRTTEGRAARGATGDGVEIPSASRSYRSPPVRWRRTIALRLLVRGLRDLDEELEVPGDHEERQVLDAEPEQVLGSAERRASAGRTPSHPPRRAATGPRSPPTRRPRGAG